MSALATSARTVMADIVAALTPDNGLPGSLGNPVRAYDSAPADPIYPYLTFGDVRSEDRSADGVCRTVHQLSLHIWSRYDGRAEVLDRLADVQRQLSDNLPHTVVPLLSDVFSAVSGGAPLPHTRHGLLRLSITTETDI